MTEKQAWLKFARDYDSTKHVKHIGLCRTIEDSGVSGDMGFAMRERLRWFRPYPHAVWYWPCNRTRLTSTLRATACCFLAAMCDDVAG